MLAWCDEQLVLLCVEGLRVLPALIVIFGGTFVVGLLVQWLSAN